MMIFIFLMTVTKRVFMTCYASNINVYINIKCKTTRDIVVLTGGPANPTAPIGPGSPLDP